MLILLSLVGGPVAVSACSSHTATPAPAAASSPSTTGASTSTTSTTPATYAPPAKSDPVDAAFRARVGTLCQGWLTDINKHGPPFYMGNPLALTSAQLPQAGSYLDSLAINHDLVSSTSNLGSPSAGQESWSTLRSDFTEFQKDQAAAIAAAKASDLAGWVASASAADATRKTIVDDLGRAGFIVGDLCRIPFAQPAYHGE
jgi:hypothetical protein